MIMKRLLLVLCCMGSVRAMEKQGVKTHRINECEGRPYVCPDHFFYCDECQRKISYKDGLSLKFHLAQEHGICHTCNVRCNSMKLARVHNYRLVLNHVINVHENQ